MKNTMGKTRKIDNPYMVYQSYDGTWEWRVLKTYQSPQNEAENPYARWFCAVKSPMTYGSWEYGDTYIKDIKEQAVCIQTFNAEILKGA